MENWKTLAKAKQIKIRMSDNTMTINLQAPVFSGKEEEWLDFIVKL